MKVRCVDNKKGFDKVKLTLGKIYEESGIECPYGSLYSVKDDSGEINLYYKSRFEIVKEKETS